MNYRVFKSEYFLKKQEKVLSSEEVKELHIFINCLKIGKIRGKPLGYKFLREKKINGKRVYFLVYESYKIVLLVNLSNKKYQKSVIRKIKLLLDEYRTLAYELYKKN